jgi:ribonuclease III family protein
MNEFVKSKEESILYGNDDPSQNPSCYRALKVACEHLPQKLSRSELQQLSPTALAYLGDAVYELYIRMYYLLPPQRVNSYHSQVVAQVRAETQAQQLLMLIPHLSETELEIVRRGRNATTGRPKRVASVTYQQATSLETLIGYLYLTDEPRLTELLQKLHLEK